MTVWLPLDTHIPKNLATSFEIRVLSQVGTAWWFSARWCSTSGPVNNTKIGNESQVYRSARQSCLKCQDPTHNDGLCLLTGACRTSPVESLYTKSSEPSLLHQRAFLTISCVLNTRGLPKPYMPHLCFTHHEQITPLCKQTTLYKTTWSLLRKNLPRIRCPERRALLPKDQRDCHPHCIILHIFVSLLMHITRKNKHHMNTYYKIFFRLLRKLELHWILHWRVEDRKPCWKCSYVWTLGKLLDCHSLFRFLQLKYTPCL